MKLLPTEVHKRTYVILTVIITLPMLLFAFVNTCNTRTILLQQKKKELALIVNRLDERLSQSYNSILSQANALQLPPEEKRKLLHKYLQPIVSEVSKKYPGYGIGYYHPELNMLAMEPYNPVLIGQKEEPLSLEVYNKRAVMVAELDSGITRNGKPLLTMNYPLYYDGDIIGHVWANVTIEDVNREIYLIVGRNLTIILLFWFSIFTVFRWAFKKIDTSLVKLAHQVEQNDIRAEQFAEFPQLVPVLETVSSLRQTIKKEYEKKELLNLELARLDRLNLISQMAAGVAHEIRNPMTVVMGYIQRMAQKAEEKTQNQYCLILDELKRVDEIISDFLSLARNKPLELNQQQLNTIISNLYPFIYADAVSKCIDMDLRLDGSLIEIECNKKEISQLILNLCRNSIEAMENKGKLIITTVQKNEDVELCIEDTGCGIRPEILEKIFDPFFTTKENGTGLGLAVCRGIVERHSGNMSIESLEKIGTKFTITLPVVISKT